MPTSFYYQIEAVLELILLTQPKSLLDIGIGFGKYGFLAREYLDLGDWDTHYEGKRSLRIDGIEGFPDYVKSLQREIYDNIYLGDALALLPTLDTRYDLALLIDVLEHFDYDNGVKLLKLVLEKSRNVIISTPIDIGHQGTVFGNELETHRFQWRPKHLTQFGPHFFVKNEYSMICYIGEQADAVGQRRRIDHRKSAFRRALGMRTYRALRKVLGMS